MFRRNPEEQIKVHKNFSIILNACEKVMRRLESIPEDSNYWSSPPSYKLKNIKDSLFRLYKAIQKKHGPCRITNRYFNWLEYSNSSIKIDEKQLPRTNLLTIDDMTNAIIYQFDTWMHEVEFNGLDVMEETSGYRITNSLARSLNISRDSIFNKGADAKDAIWGSALCFDVKSKQIFDEEIKKSVASNTETAENSGASLTMNGL
ncbi:MAG: hypothetical protein P1U74_03930 [Legionellaceae bacterium]|nr:hypothetical protein [Legionellaceae bacterium]